MLQQNGCYETEEGMRRRQNLISEMDTLVKQWIRSISLSKRMNWQDAEQVRLLTANSPCALSILKESEGLLTIVFVDLTCRLEERSSPTAHTGWGLSIARLTWTSCALLQTVSKG